MAEARSNESLKITNKNEFTESDKEAAEQLIQLNDEDRIKSINSLNRKRKFELVVEAITKIESHEPKNHQYEMKKFRSLVGVYMETAPKRSRKSINRKRNMTTLQKKKADQGIKAVTKIESSQANNHQEMKKYRPLVDIHKVTTPITINGTKKTKTLN